MTSVIDRRSDSKNKSAINRERFLKRYRGKIKEAVAESIRSRSIKDIENGDEVSIPSKDIKEPYFGHGNGGIWETVVPGNDEYEKGDLIRRPNKGRGSGTGDPSDSADPFDDEFVFTLSKEEFMQYFFEDLALPNLVKKQLKDSTATKHQRAGFKTSGATTNIHVLRSLRNATGRRIAGGGKYARRLKEIEKELEELVGVNHDNWSTTTEENVRAAALYEEGAILRAKISRIPFIDTFDLRYSNTIEVPKPSSKAVMFCLMDVSGSMDEEKKDIAKRFFILLYLFLNRNYEKIDVVFIRHHTLAAEVSEHDFFYSKETGGTMVSSALQLLDEIIEERYSTEDWNVYVAQASDGDNWSGDSVQCKDLINASILPAVQYFAYIEIAAGQTQDLWDHYQDIAAENSNFVIRQLESAADIYPVFCDLFKKQELQNGN